MKRVFFLAVVTAAVLLTAQNLTGQDKAAPKAAPKAAVKKAAPEPAVRRDPGAYAIFTTAVGKIVCVLYEKEAPITTKNFEGLAEGTKEWTDPRTNKKVKTPLYNGTVFHRTIPNFMIQGGDPLGTGGGEPGFVIPNEVPAGKGFDKAGVLAMANRGPNTGGSQFFITDVPVGLAPASYTIFGQVVEGQDVVSKIAHFPCKGDQPCTSQNDKPMNPVKVLKVTIQRVK
jgi:peptidyl-prolyl cis-trans isomerase A (cyclophilin A)